MHKQQNQPNSDEPTPHLITPLQCSHSDTFHFHVVDESATKLQSKEHQEVTSKCAGDSREGSQVFP